MPKLWTDTIEAHHEAVREAVLDQAAKLISKDGLSALTMSRLAETSGIGRATLYKYFGDLQEVLAAWHERHIAEHLRQLHAARERTSDSLEALETVLLTYAMGLWKQRGEPLAAALHKLPHMPSARDRLTHFVRVLFETAAKEGRIRSDVPANELAGYALAAIEAAAECGSATAVKRLVSLIMQSLAK